MPKVILTRSSQKASRVTSTIVTSAGHTWTWTAIERRQMANDYVGRNVERPDKTWEWRISVVDVAARRVLADRGFSGSGAPAFVSFVGIWRNGTWQQGA